MKASEAIRKVMEIKGVKFSVLMGRLGLKSNALANRLSMPNMSIAKLSEMAKALDYKVVLVPRETRINSESFEVE